MVFVYMLSSKITTKKLKSLYIQLKKILNKTSLFNLLIYTFIWCKNIKKALFFYLTNDFD